MHFKLTIPFKKMSTIVPKPSRGRMLISFLKQSFTVGFKNIESPRRKTGAGFVSGTFLSNTKISLVFLLTRTNIKVLLLGISITLGVSTTAQNISLEISDSSFHENSGEATLTAVSDTVFTSDTEVVLSFSGTATLGEDYTASDTLIIIPVGTPDGSITVTTIDDVIYEGDETIIIEIESVNNGSVVSPSRITASIIDNESPPAITLAASPLTISEDTSTILTATLNNATFEEVVVTLATNDISTSADDYTLSQDTITIAAGQTSGTATLAPIEDGIYEDTEEVEIFIAEVSGGASSINTPNTVTLSITESLARPTVSLGASRTTFAENDSSILTASLNYPTYEDVTVNLMASDVTTQPEDYNLTTSSITIPAGELTGTTTLKGVEDAVHEGEEQMNVAITSVSGGDATRDGAQEITFTITDNQAPPEVTLSASTHAIEEAGTSTLTASLSNATFEEVVVTLDTNDISTSPEDYNLSSDTITISAGQTSGNVTLTTIEDAIHEGDESLEISISRVSGGSASIGTPLNVTITIIDNQNPPTVTFSASPLTIHEDGTSTLTASLSTATAEDVTVILATNNITTGPGDYNLTSDTITIKAGNLSGTTTLTGVADNTYEGNEMTEIYISSVSGGSAWLPESQRLTIILIDNDPPPTVTLSASPISMPEDGSSTITATLSNATYENVLIIIEPTNITTSDEDYNLRSTSVFIPAGQLSGSTVLDAIPDEVYEGDEEVQVSITALAGGSATLGDNESVVMNIEDAQTPPPASLELTGSPFSENGGTAAVNIHVGHTSFQDIQVDLSYTGTAPAADYSGATSTVTIPAGSTEETILLTGIDNLQADGDRTIVISITSVTNATTGDDNLVTATILDDDIAGITPIISDANTITSESGSSDAFEIVLNTRPASDVNIEITGLDTTEGQLGTRDLTFTRDNWNQPRVVTVTGVDDDEVDGDIRYTLTIAVIDELSDNSYHGLSTTVDIINTDNDAAGFTVTLTNSSTITSESGTSDVFSVVLNSQPLSNVVFGITGLDETEGMLSTGELTFTPDDWNQPRTVTITGMDDDEVDGDITYFLTLAVINDISDETYHGQSKTIEVTNTDSDTGGLIIAPEDASLQTSENGTSDNFSLELSAQPASNVVINIAGLDETEGTLDMDELTFTSGNWNEPRTVTVTGVNDNLVDGDVSYTLRLTVIDNLSDQTFHGLSSTIDVLNTDNDTAEQENQPPTPADDVFEVDQNTTLTGSSLLSNDSDPDGDDLTIDTTPTIQPLNGVLVINDNGTFSYTPDNGFLGTDSFTYEVFDNGTPPLRGTAMVTIHVKEATTRLEVRDGFSPEHGHYIIPWLNQYDKVSLVVFNRWGNVVYRQDKYENNWNGESNKGFSIGNKLPVGTYYYVITIADNNKRLSGYIYLTR